jgi:hypothetical protein
MYKTKTTLIQRYDVHLHGWDAQAETWHGPNGLSAGARGTRHILSKVKIAGRAFQLKLKCCVPGLPCMEFSTAIYDLRDTGLGIVHLDGVHGGPVGILAVLPRSRRRLLRNDFPFELMSVISFLGAPVNSGSELAIHDYIEEVLRTERSSTHVFAVETGELGSDDGIVLSAHFEQLAAAMLDWLAMRESQDDTRLEADEFEACTSMLRDCPSTQQPSRGYAV